ncbi:HpcH/HpaI aldolase/citrate lyase family protein [Pseudoglutamicibacter albus]|uniref:Citrate lyase subunit beta/citryl-CoA lyase n=1 Tax=Pseudoglutamicibacter albus TaxID=98671 RepID=A0ABU1YWW3_9MICC|nr:CoA ester lyase [Pseudoglutamicibacter albus]MDR7292842.1 citrate lyase subunit beta/citryl-CoA lyase [Pseudoglutamicibacter albus]
MKPARSVLFVPGHRRSMIDKALASNADALILDLEDAVPESEKQLARETVTEVLESASPAGPQILVRPNALDTEHFGRDIATVASPALTAFLLPKLFSRDDVISFDALVTAAEINAGIQRGRIGLVPSLETAASVNRVDEILQGPRVVGVMAAAAKNADISREVGFNWSEEGTETLYLRSKVVVAARAAGVRIILLGLWQEVNNLEGLERFAADNCNLGYSGQVLIHPKHIDIVNEAYGISEDDANYYRELVAAFEAGTERGLGAVTYAGEHIDKAHANHARELLSLTGYDC